MGKLKKRPPSDPDPLRDAVAALAAALVVVDDDALARASAACRRLSGDAGDALKKLLDALTSKRTPPLLERDATALEIVEAVRASRAGPLDQTTLAERVFPLATPASAASMLSRKLDVLERERLILRRKRGKSQIIELASVAHDYFAANAEAADGARARLAVILGEAERVLHDKGSAADDVVRVHLLLPYYQTCRELLAIERWTSADRKYARILAALPIQPGDAVDPGPFESALKAWSDSDPKRLLLELTARALHPERRGGRDFAGQVAYVGSRLDRASDDNVLWGRLSCIAAPRFGDERLRRRELLEAVVNRLDGGSSSSNVEQRRYVQGFAAHALGSWAYAGQVFEQVERASSPSDAVVEKEVQERARKNVGFAAQSGRILRSFEEFFCAQGAPNRWARELLTNTDVDELFAGWLDRLTLRRLDDVRRCTDRFEMPLPAADARSAQDETEAIKSYQDILRLAADPDAGARWLESIERPNRPTEEEMRTRLLDLQFPLPIVLLQRGLPDIWSDIRGERKIKDD